ncbi:MAG: S8 family serine peptidase, partial [Gammaproteobacteria bacterium]|nr:S8 family serine peptidase [Gammaproteobacteria bacterium]
LGYKPKEGSHGTPVMDIACGNGLGTKTRGIAPEASIIFVESSQSDIPRSGEAVIGDNNTGGSSFYGDSVNLLNAIEFIFKEAATTPCVVNISLGSTGGPHDGSSLVEQGLDSFTQIPNRAVVVAAGNGYGNSKHASGFVPTGGYIDLIWKKSSPSEEEIEIWYSGKDEFKLEILDDRDNSYGDISLDTGPKSFSSQTIVAIHRKHDPNNFDNNINIYLRKTSLRNIKFRLHGIAITNGKFHAWIEENFFRSSSEFLNPDNNYTLSSIACSKKSIVVGAFDAKGSEQELLKCSSAGPTRDSREKPETSAPGKISAAESLSPPKPFERSGTSMATAVVTGAIALMLAEARNLGKDLTIDQIRKILINTAHPPGTGATGWDGRYGMGKINLVGAIEAIRQL